MQKWGISVNMDLYGDVLGLQQKLNMVINTQQSLYGYDWIPEYCRNYKNQVGSAWGQVQTTVDLQIE